LGQAALCHPRRGFLQYRRSALPFAAAYAIWIPPGLSHHSSTPQATRYASVYVHRDHCSALPQRPCTLQIKPLLRAIVDDFASRGVHEPATEADARLALVLLDQVRLAPRQDSYLPTSNDALLGPVLTQLQANPATGARWRLAHERHTTERTLARRCRRDLGCRSTSGDNDCAC